MNTWTKWFVIGRRINIGSAVASFIMIAVVAAALLWQRYQLTGERLDADAKETAEMFRTTTGSLIWNFDTNAMTEVQKKSKSRSIESISFFDNNDKPLIPVEELKVSHPVFTASADVVDANGKKAGRVDLRYNKLEQREEFLRDSRVLGTAFAFLLILQFVSSGGTLWANGKILNSLGQLVSRVKSSADLTTEKANSVRASADIILDVAREQSAATEQTVTAIGEIRSTMGRTRSSVDESTEKARESSRLASDGKTSVEKMVHAVGDISASNDETFREMESTTQGLNEIVRVIREISDKTKVINDIVFQTKLLSFNASVEAARAGEHGKGFAVVAEEVGTLARMSGTASTEIDALLRESVEKAESIVSSTTQGLTRSIARSKNSANVGVETAQACGDLFERLADHITKVEAVMIQLKGASSEQGKAIEDIFQAATLIQQATDRSIANANDTSTNAEELANESHRLTGIGDELSTALGQSATASVTAVDFGRSNSHSRAA